MAGTETNEASERPGSDGQGPEGQAPVAPTLRSRLGEVGRRLRRVLSRETGSTELSEDSSTPAPGRGLRVEIYRDPGFVERARQAHRNIAT
jgi:hypothetical protein